MQILAIVVSLAIAAVGIVLFVQAIRSMVATARIGQPVVGRTDRPAARSRNLTMGVAWRRFTVLHSARDPDVTVVAPSEERSRGDVPDVAHHSWLWDGAMAAAQ